jgi:hypothetical protein
MSKRKADTEKYNKKFVRGLPAPYKLLWDYLYLNCNHAGIWNVEIDVAQTRVAKTEKNGTITNDAPINVETALELFNEDEERIKVLDNGKKWFIAGFIEFQQSIFSLSELNPSNKVHNSILTILKKEGIPISVEPIEIRTKFTDDSVEMHLSKLLLSLILERKPDYKVPDLQKWCIDADKMIRLDKRQSYKIEQVIIWCQHDSGDGKNWKGWQNNILSMGKLREKFDKLELEMNKKPYRKGAGSGTKFEGGEVIS